jgi:hypothetical protein
MEAPVKVRMLGPDGKPTGEYRIYSPYVAQKLIARGEAERVRLTNADIRNQ